MNGFSPRSVGRRRSSCRGKIHHKDWVGAAAAAVVYYAERGVSLHHYCCPHCDEYHVGHANGQHGQSAVWLACDAALSDPPEPTPFQKRLRERAVAAAAEVCRGSGRDPEGAIAVVLGGLSLPGLAGRLTPAQCEDVLLACERVQQWFRLRTPAFRSKEKETASCG